MTDEEMAAALRAKGWFVRPPFDPSTCTHPRLSDGVGSGSISSDGSGSCTTQCPDCEKRFEQNWGARNSFEIMGHRDRFGDLLGRAATRRDER